MKNISIEKAHYAWIPDSNRFYVTDDEKELDGCYCNQEPYDSQHGCRTKMQRQLKLFVELWHRMLLDNMNAIAMHNELVKIPEYRELWSGEYKEGMLKKDDMHCKIELAQRRLDAVTNNIETLKQYINIHQYKIGTIPVTDGTIEPSWKEEIRRCWVKYHRYVKRQMFWRKRLYELTKASRA